MTYSKKPHERDEDDPQPRAGCNCIEWTDRDGTKHRDPNPNCPVHKGS